jgi:hypothetical protein
MKREPIVGEKVKLNDVGYEWGVRLKPSEFDGAKSMTVTSVRKELVDDADIWVIETDYKPVSRFMLHNLMVDPV